MNITIYDAPESQTDIAVTCPSQLLTKFSTILARKGIKHAEQWHGTDSELLVYPNKLVRPDLEAAIRQVTHDEAGIA